MRVRIDLQPPENGVLLPIQYNYLIQGAIYQALLPDDQSFFHDRGFSAGGRQFKLFTFSRLLGRFERGEGVPTGHLRFVGPLQLMVASPAIKFLSSLVTGLLQSGSLRLGSATLSVVGIQPMQDGLHLNPSGPVQEDQTAQSIILTAKVRTLSPIVVYSTLLRPDGRKYTVYYQPGDPDFTPLVAENLRKKYTALYGNRPSEVVNGPVSIRVRGQPRLSVMTYKGTVIKGYSGRLELTAPLGLLQMALDAGLGAKNSQGFGCLELEESPLPASSDARTNDVMVPGEKENRESKDPQNAREGDR